MYAVQKGIKLDAKSPDAKKFLFGLMDSLETVSFILKYILKYSVSEYFRLFVGKFTALYIDPWT